MKLARIGISITLIILTSFNVVQAVTPSAVHFFFEPGLREIYGIHGYQRISYPWGSQILPPSYDGNSLDNEEGNFLYLYSRKRAKVHPTTQWITFKIKSNNFFKTNGHLAIIVNADNSSHLNTGRGLIIGRNTRSDNGMPCHDYGIGSGWIQPEIWWDLPYVTSNTQGTWVGDGSYCSKNPLFDNTVYEILIHSDSIGYHYSVYDEKLNLITDNYVLDNHSNNFYSGLVAFGVTFGIVFGNADFAWDIKLHDIKSGEF